MERPGRPATTSIHRRGSRDQNPQPRSHSQPASTRWIEAEEIAVGYKQLIAVERGWRDLKTHLELRPVYHRREDRIRAHVLLCWLTLLLIRIAETKTGRSWAAVREDLSDLAVGVFTGAAGTYAQTSALRPATREALTALGVTAPKTVLTLAVAPTRARRAPATA